MQKSAEQLGSSRSGAALRPVLRFNTFGFLQTSLAHQEQTPSRLRKVLVAYIAFQIPRFLVQVFYVLKGGGMKGMRNKVHHSSLLLTGPIRHGSGQNKRSMSDAWLAANSSLALGESAVSQTFLAADRQGSCICSCMGVLRHDACSKYMLGPYTR